MVLILSVGNAAAVSYTFANIVDSSGPLFSIRQGQGRSLNNSGTVAFAAEPDREVGSGIFTGSGGPITTIAFSRDSVLFGPSLNQSGTGKSRGIEAWGSLAKLPRKEHGTDMGTIVGTNRREDR